MEHYAAIISLIAVLMGLAYAQTDYGNGIRYKEYATADVWLERTGVNYNRNNFLIVSSHPGYPKKQSLVQFDISSVPSTCNVKFAKMYINFWYAHKASSRSV